MIYKLIYMVQKIERCSRATKMNLESRSIGARKKRTTAGPLAPQGKHGLPRTSPLCFRCVLWVLDMQVHGLSESNPTSMYNEAMWHAQTSTHVPGSVSCTQVM